MSIELVHKEGGALVPAIIDSRTWYSSSQ